jgi:hypothetical protein
VLDSIAGLKLLLLSHLPRSAWQGQRGKRFSARSVPSTASGAIASVPSGTLDRTRALKCQRA